jgi:proline racemase
VPAGSQEEEEQIMRINRSLTCWDYHHGQATRILVAGFPPIPGSTMLEKQANFEESLSCLRTALLMEPRGHRNMIGAIVTEPVRPESIIGVIFTHPAGYFSMCGDSAFSVTCFLVESGMLGIRSGEVSLEMDTVAGPVRADVVIQDGECISATIQNVESYMLGAVSMEVNGNVVSCPVSYGGLNYALVPAKAVGIPALRFADLDDDQRRGVLNMGSAALRAAQLVTGNGTSLPSVDLVTLYEPLEGDRGVRVANFYAPGTMGRTPSGTGLSARLAWEYASGNLAIGEDFVHESVLGMRFVGRVEAVRERASHESSTQPAVVPSITARSFLMGIQQVMITDDDPFKEGFQL